MVERAAIVADLGIKAHAHMLRHACGFKLADDGHDTRALQAYRWSVPCSSQARTRFGLARCSSSRASRYHLGDLLSENNARTFRDGEGVGDN